MIGDRNPANRPYLRHVYGGLNALHELRATENKAILDRVLMALGGSVASGDWFRRNTQLVERSPLFVVLFVLSHDGSTRDDVSHLDLDDGIEATFQTIIVRKLQKLERQNRYSGFGRAVVLLAHLYAAEESPWESFSEEFLTHVARFFANTADDSTPGRPDWQYPDALSGLMHRALVRRNDPHCRFNHDIIAERGIVKVGLRAPELHIDFDPRSRVLHDLLDYLIVHSVASGAVVLWCWLAYRDGFSSEDTLLTKLQEILSRPCKNPTT